MPSAQGAPLVIGASEPTADLAIFTSKPTLGTGMQVALPARQGPFASFVNARRGLRVVSSRMLGPQTGEVLPSVCASVRVVA